MRNHRRRPGWKLLLACLTGFALVTACSTTAATNNTETSNSTASSEASGEATEPGQSDEERVFVYAAAAVPSNLDAWAVWEGDATRAVLYEWNSTLVDYDVSDEPNSGCDIIPPPTAIKSGLASSWEYNADKTQLIIKLRDGVKSAEGNAMTSEDVVWSLQRSLELSAQSRYLSQGIVRYAAEDTFEAIDELTVAVNLAQATALDMTLLQYPMFSVLDYTAIKSHITDDDPWAKEWLTTNYPNFGPWQMSSFTPGDQITMVPNPHYWDSANRGNVTQLVMRAVADPATRMQLVQTGDADYAEKLSFDQYASLQNSDEVHFANCASPNRDTLFLQQEGTVFADADVRRAVSMAIDRDALSQGVYKGLWSGATTGISASYWKAPDTADTYQYDPEAARQIFESAGVTDLTFEILASPTRPGAQAQALGVQIQAMLDKVGVKTSIRMVAGASEFTESVNKQSYEMLVYLEPPAVGDPAYSLLLYNGSQSHNNTFNYENQKYDDISESVLTTPPSSERDQLMVEASNLITEENPQVYLIDNRYLYAFSKAVSGMSFAPHGAILIKNLSKQ